MTAEFIREVLTAALADCTVDHEGFPVELNARQGETTVIVTLRDTYQYGQGEATIALRIERL